METTQLEDVMNIHSFNTDILFFFNLISMYILLFTFIVLLLVGYIPGAE